MAAAPTQRRNSYSIKLNTPDTPRQQDLPVAFQLELINIYQAIKNLASLVDTATGRQITPPGEEPDGDADIRNTFIVERFSYIYLPFTMNAVYGDLIAIDSLGRGIFPVASAGPSPLGAARHPVGYVAEEEVAAGTYGKVAVRGIIRSSGGTPNRFLTWNYTGPTKSFAYADGAGSQITVNAKFLTDKYIYFTGNTHINRYST